MARLVNEILNPSREGHSSHAAVAPPSRGTVLGWSSQAWNSLTNQTILLLLLLLLLKFMQSKGGKFLPSSRTDLVDLFTCSSKFPDINRYILDALKKS